MKVRSNVVYKALAIKNLLENTILLPYEDKQLTKLYVEYGR